MVIGGLMATDWAFHYFYLHSMFNHIDLVETTNQLPGFCVLTLLAIYEWLKIFFLYELVRHIMNIDARSGPEYPKPLYKVYFFSETSFDRALQVSYFYNFNNNIAPYCSDHFILFPVLGGQVLLVKMGRRWLDVRRRWRFHHLFLCLAVTRPAI